MTRHRPARRLLLLTLFALAPLATGCGLLGDDSEDGAASSVFVEQVTMSTEITEEAQATGFVTRAFPTDTRQVYAALVLSGVQSGQQVMGRWFQLSVEGAGPEGHLVSEAGVMLTDDQVDDSGRAQIFLTLASDAEELPAGDWVVRVYIDEEFVRTLGFVVSEHVAYDPGVSGRPSNVPPGVNTQSDVTPTPEPTATEAPPEPQVYTVESGDTLTVIAEQFKPPEESVDAYISRILELNGLEPDAIIIAGQELLLPP